MANDHVTHDKGDEGALAGANDKKFLDRLLCMPPDGVTTRDVQRLLWMAVAMQERLAISAVGPSMPEDEATGAGMVLRMIRDKLGLKDGDNVLHYIEKRLGQSDEQLVTTYADAAAEHMRGCGTCQGGAHKAGLRAIAGHSSAIRRGIPVDESMIENAKLAKEMGKPYVILAVKPEAILELVETKV